MYESHFGLSGQPFQLNPDPAFFFPSAGHGKALSYLRYGAQQGEGFIVVTGDVGAGKTMVVGTLMQEIDPQQVVVALISNTQLEASDLLQSILTAFGAPTEGKSKARLIAMLEAFLTAVVASGRRALLIVDEAQNLSPQAFEELRLLSNFQLGHHGLLQCFLIGQPGLRTHLQAPAAEQLRQRVLASYHLGPLSADETADYVRHRLTHAGWSGRPMFSAEALAAIHVYAGGIPRRINTLCNRVLLATYLAGSNTVGLDVVDETAAEMQLEIVASPAPTPQASPALAHEPAVAPVPVVEPAAVAVPAMEPGHTAAIERGEPAEPDARASAPAALAAAAVRVAPVSEAPAANHTPAPSTPSSERPHSWDQGVSHVGAERAMLPAAPVLCVADDPMSWHKLRSLAAPWGAEADLPPMLLVNPGLRSTLQRSWLGQVPTDHEVPEVHLGVGIGPVGQTDAAVALRFAELATESCAAGVVLAGTSHPVLQCALIARELGLPVIRIEAGAHRGDVESGRGVLSALIDRASDLLFTASESESRVLADEGFAASQRVIAGSLTAHVLHELQPRVPVFSEVMTRLGAPRSWLTRAAVGFGLISAQFEQGDVSPGDALQWLMLARYGSSELPLLWPVSDRTAAVMKDPAIQIHLESAGIAVVRAGDYFQQLSLLGRARCVVAGPARTLVDEAAAHAIPSIVVQLYADAPATPESGLVTRVGPSAAQFKAAVRSAFQMVRTDRTVPDATQDGRQGLVEELGRWLPRHLAPLSVKTLDEAAA